MGITPEDMIKHLGVLEPLHEYMGRAIDYNLYQKGEPKDLNLRCFKCQQDRAMVLQKDPSELWVCQSCGLSVEGASLDVPSPDTIKEYFVEEAKKIRLKKVDVLFHRYLKVESARKEIVAETMQIG